MGRHGEHLMYEADIGSGEKSPADAETQKMIEQIPGLEMNSTAPGEPSSTDQSMQDNPR